MDQGQREARMFKLSTVLRIFSVLAALFFFGCSSDDGTDDTGDNPPGDPAPGAQEAPTLIQGLVIDQWELETTK